MTPITMINGDRSVCEVNKERDVVLGLALLTKGGSAQKFLHVTIITLSNSFTLFITSLSHFRFDRSTSVYELACVGQCGMGQK